MPLSRDRAGLRLVIHALQQAWLSRGWLARLLWPLAGLHAMAVSFRVALYRLGVFKSEGFPVAVVVVGNLIAGGAGKTPLVVALTKHLQSKGHRVGVVSRGYGRTVHKTLEVGAHTVVEASGDEPALIKQATGAPVFVAKKRVDAVRLLLATYPETSVVISDDGLQHYALRRDIEIAAFDDRGVGNGWLMPAGPLREPWPGRKKRGIDLILHTGQSPAFAGYLSTRKLADFAVAPDGSTTPLAALKGQHIDAIAAIADPEAFFRMLRQTGLVLQHTIALPDHDDFKAFKLDRRTSQILLCTEKDAVKLFAKQKGSQMKLLAVPLEFTPEPAFLLALDVLLAKVLSQLPSAHGHQTT